MSNENARERQQVVARMRQMTGRLYPDLEVAMETMPTRALVDLMRFMNDAQAEISRAKRDAVLKPWVR